MLSLQTIEEYLAYAAVSEFLAVEENGKNKALNGGHYEGDKDIPLLLYALQENLNWAKQYYVGTEQIDLVANYMYALCGKYLGKAKTYNPGSAGSSDTSEDAPTDNAHRSVFQKVQFVVGGTLGSNSSGGVFSNEFSSVFDTAKITSGKTFPPSLMNDGDTTLTLEAAGIVDKSVRVTIDGVVIPENLEQIMSYVPVYSSTGVELTFNQTVSPGQVFIIQYEKLSS